MVRFFTLLFYIISFSYISVHASDVNEEALSGEAKAPALRTGDSSTVSVSIGNVADFRDHLRNLRGRGAPDPAPQAERAQANPGGQTGSTLQRQPDEEQDSAPMMRPAFDAQQQVVQREQPSRCQRFWRFICCCCCCCCCCNRK